nr:MAG TPA: hypothetical protein [Bacteriophage sp.]
MRLFFVAFRTNFIAIKKKTTRTACAALFILVVFLLLLKCAKRKAKFYFIPIQKKKEKTSRSCQLPRDFSFVQYQCLYFYSNTSYVIINLLTMGGYGGLILFKYILCYY